jgi:hypothetical protein
MDGAVAFEFLPDFDGDILSSEHIERPELMLGTVDNRGVSEASYLKRFTFRDRMS